MQNRAHVQKFLCSSQPDLDVLAALSPKRGHKRGRGLFQLSRPPLVNQFLTYSSCHAASIKNPNVLGLSELMHHSSRKDRLVKSGGLIKRLEFHLNLYGSDDIFENSQCFCW